MKPFAMERWQSTYEYRVTYNLSESGVHPLTLGELVEMAGASRGIFGASLGYGQSNGSDELRDHIARLYAGATEANVVATNGSAEANFIAMWELLDGADGEVVMLLPAYMQTHGLADAFGARVNEVWLREELGWQPDPDEILKAVDKRTRVIIVTNPNNPTGAVLSAEARDALIRAADQTGAWILADEVYTGAELRGPETHSFWGSFPRVVATGSLSKAYGLPGLRIGWVVAPADMAARLWARKDYTTIAPGSLTDRLAALALDPTLRPRLLQRTRAMLHAGLETLSAWAASLGVFEFRPPDAGAICYMRYSLPIPSLELAERLRVEQDVLIVPGAHFGMESFIRIGYGLPPAELAAALERTGALLRVLAAGGAVR